MREQIKEWLINMPEPRGVLAVGVFFPDQTTLSKSFSPNYPIVTLEHTWRSVADLVRVLKVHRLPKRRMQWVYQHATLRCVAREDGLILGVFTTDESAEGVESGAEALIGEFLSFLGSTD